MLYQLSYPSTVFMYTNAHKGNSWFEVMRRSKSLLYMVPINQIMHKSVDFSVAISSLMPY